MPNKVIDIVNHTLHRTGFDYSQIDENIFLGTNMCCQLGFDQELLSKNVRADISLEEDRVDAPNGVDYFLWLPTKDHFAPTFDKLTLGVYTLEFLVKRNIKVYIHCKNGHGRAPTLLAAYLIKKGMKLSEAIKFMQSKRPSVRLTRHQIDSLQKFAKM